MGRDYKGNATLGTQSWAAQLSTEAGRGLGSYSSHYPEQPVGTAGPKASPVA